MLISSHKPKYVDMILDGTKTALLLSRTPKRGCAPGDWQAIWTTSPVSAIQCCVRVKRAHGVELTDNGAYVYDPTTGDIKSYDWYRSHTGVANMEIKTFIIHSPSPCVVWFDRVELTNRRFDTPGGLMTVETHNLAVRWGITKLWTPPQPYRYLTPQQSSDLNKWTDGRMLMAKQNNQRKNRGA